MEEFPSNLPRSKPMDEKEVRKVVVSEAKIRKAPLNRRILQTFFKGDAKQTWTGVMTEVALPAIMDMVADVATQGVERLIFGETRSRSRRPNSGFGNSDRYAGPSMNYSRYAGRPTTHNPEPPRARVGRYQFDDITVESRIEGQTVLEEMYTMLQRYKTVSVSDLYEMVGLTAEHTDEKWGWTDLQETEIVRQRDGRYLISLPKPTPLD